MKEMIRFIGLDVHKDFMADGGAGPSQPAEI